MLEYLIFINTAKGWVCGWIMHFVLPLPLAHIPPYEALISLSFYSSAPPMLLSSKPFFSSELRPAARTVISLLFLVAVSNLLWESALLPDGPVEFLLLANIEVPESQQIMTATVWAMGSPCHRSECTRFYHSPPSAHIIRGDSSALPCEVGKDLNFDRLMNDRGEHANSTKEDPSCTRTHTLLA